jgi:hypothetical protein
VYLILWPSHCQSFSVGSTVGRVGVTRAEVGADVAVARGALATRDAVRRSAWETRDVTMCAGADREAAEAMATVEVRCVVARALSGGTRRIVATGGCHVVRRLVSWWPTVIRVSETQKYTNLTPNCSYLYT